jgi:hypothetical protein
MIVTEGTRVRVVWGAQAHPGVVTQVFKEDTGTHYMIHLDNGRNLSTTIDSLITEKST